jgi:hypothetical protein
LRNPHNRRQSMGRQARGPSQTRSLPVPCLNAKSLTSSRRLLTRHIHPTRWPSQASRWKEGPRAPVNEIPKSRKKLCMVLERVLYTPYTVDFLQA